MLTRLLGLALALATTLPAEDGATLRFCLRVDPKTFDPLLVEDDASEVIRYLTGGFLIRRNRLTQELEGELASHWQISEQGRRIDFQLRPDLKFSDGTPFSCEDVVYTMKRVMDPALHSPVGDQFRTGPGAVEAACSGPGAVSIRFPTPVSALADQFDQLAISKAHAPHDLAAVLGPFKMAEYKPGSFVRLESNPYYWKTDSKGRRLPYLHSIRLDIQQNRDLEVMRFRRGDLDLVEHLDAEAYERLAREIPLAVTDAGPSLDWEVIFFNQVAKAPLPAYKQRWFRSTAFRRAVSEAINREDICRIVYRGHAQPAAGPVSTSNRFWRNAALRPDLHSPTAALQRLEKDGFHRSGTDLFDRDGNRVEFSLITNAGGRTHERMLALIQQDLAQIGIRVNVVPLEFSSLIERISRSFNYDAALMSFVNIDLDPNAQKNIWLSTADNHQWNPNQKSPETDWEARLDKLMLLQTETLDRDKRKVYFDELQQLVVDQAPMIFLVNPNSLGVVSLNLKNVSAATLHPQLYWNAERLYFSGGLVSMR
jgi:peptide/nickel transport system substrate-binding protein